MLAIADPEPDSAPILSLRQPVTMNATPIRLDPQPSHAELARLCDKYPVSMESERTMEYGTAGFRYDAAVLPPVMVRVGILATLRALETASGYHVGVMVTASHNDESYNGVKIADPDGGMMNAQGERLAVYLANERNTDALVQYFVAQQAKYTTEKRIHSGNAATEPVVVHVGRDTRSHSPFLTCLVVKAARACGALVLDHGVVTTPMLHHTVLHANHVKFLPKLIPHRPHVDGYQRLLIDSYRALLATTDNQAPLQRSLLVDCACGVGYIGLEALLQTLDQQSSGFGSSTTIVPTNGPDSGGPLNESCGSEYVQKIIIAPTWYDADLFTSATTSEGRAIKPASVDKSYCAALDGDADRIVFFSEGGHGSDFFLLDGDKIACLLCDFVGNELAILQKAVPSISFLSLGVVQTAYANGASTAYLEQKLGKANVAIAKTGVKHVHAAAHQFDIGVYFEANGHGTIVFGDRYCDALNEAAAFLSTAVQDTVATRALRRLETLPRLVNQAVGDALSDLLLVDAILTLRRWTLAEWNAIYQDLPSRQDKIRVQDRSIIQTNDNETRCLAPASVQPRLDELVQQHPSGRCFIRPSGTEDVVRIYAEAATREAADTLCQAAARVVHDECQGVGEPPSIQSRM
jgi:phosphoacetylglucosamine mutase